MYLTSCVLLEPAARRVVESGHLEAALLEEGGGGVIKTGSNGELLTRGLGGVL